MSDDNLDLTDIEDLYPGWHTWRGVGGYPLFARMLRSSPPIVVKAPTAGELAEKIKVVVHGSNGDL